jgi:hypothetical protein
VLSVDALEAEKKAGNRSADMRMYGDLSPQLYERGEIAVMIIYSGEQQIVGYDNGGNEILEPAVTLDL